MTRRSFTHWPQTSQPLRVIGPTLAQELVKIMVGMSTRQTWQDLAQLTREHLSVLHGPEPRLRGMGRWVPTMARQESPWKVTPVVQRRLFLALTTPQS